MAHAALDAIGSLPALSALDGAPLAISEAGLKLVSGALMSREPAPLRATHNAYRFGSVAVIPIKGPLSTEGSWLSSLFGASNYESIAHDLNTAFDDAEVTAIVLDIDSPGGDTTGCQELSKLIFDARDRKQIVAYASGGMCSAAYWIGSAASVIVANPSAIVGSIGVRTMMVDVSKALEAAGITQYPIVADQAPHKVLDAASESDRARATAMVTKLAAVFIDDVARNRAIAAAKVESDFGKGDVLVGEAALAAGMVDRLGDFDSLLSELNARAASASASLSKRKGKAMSIASNRTESSVKSMTCSGCRSSMKAEDPMYCKGCVSDMEDGDGDGDDEDEESKKAKAFTATVCAILGESDHAAAAQVLAKLKSDAAEIAKLKAEVAEQKKPRETVELKAILDAATVAGKVTPAGRVEFEKLAAEAGIEFVKRALAVAPAVNAAVAPAPDAPPSPGNPAADAQAQKVGGLLAEILSTTGISPEKFEEQRKRQAAAKAAYLGTVKE